MLCEFLRFVTDRVTKSLFCLISVVFVSVYIYARIRVYFLCYPVSKCWKIGEMWRICIFSFRSPDQPDSQVARNRKEIFTLGNSFTFKITTGCRQAWKVCIFYSTESGFIVHIIVTKFYYSGYSHSPIVTVSKTDQRTEMWTNTTFLSCVFWKLVKFIISGKACQGGWHDARARPPSL